VLLNSSGANAKYIADPVAQLTRLRRFVVNSPELAAAGGESTVGRSGDAIDALRIR